MINFLVRRRFKRLFFILIAFCVSIVFAEENTIVTTQATRTPIPVIQPSALPTAPYAARQAIGQQMVTAQALPVESVPPSQQTTTVTTQSTTPTPAPPFLAAQNASPTVTVTSGTTEPTTVTTQTSSPTVTVTNQVANEPSTTTVTNPPLPTVTVTDQTEQPVTTTTVTTQNSPATIVSNQSNQASDTNHFEEWLRSNNRIAPAGPDTPLMTSGGIRPIRSSVRPGRPLTYEQGQRVMLKSAPRSTIPQSPDAPVAFNQMLRQNLPLTPKQVVQLHQEIDRSQLAASISPNIPPKPVSTTIMINLAPGTTPPAIRLAQGYVSALMFVDSTGTAWPIASFDVGNPKAVNIQWDGKSNVVLIQAISPYTNGDIVVRLIGLPTPITLELVSGQRVVDYRADIHVSGIGPNTKEIPVGTNLPNSANQLLLDVLNGIAPEGSHILSVRGADAQAYLLSDRLYFRTRLPLLSPGWVGKMVSPDGMIAYELPKTSSVLVSRYGEPVELRIEGF